ncbi:hypothetical protein KI387_019244, partial [Taxus chinensis]
GKVNKVEKDYIGVIVLGIFNAAIAFEDIREEFCYQDNVDGIPLWESTSSDHVITLGSTIKFAVKSVQEESFLDISGSLNSPNTGCVKWLYSLLEKNSEFLEIERKIHKERKRERRKENIDADGGRVSKKFPADHSHEREHKHKSDHSHEREPKHKSDHSHEREPKHKSDHSHEREHKHKSDHSHEREHKHKSDHSHEREHKHKSKRKRNDTDAEVKVDGSVSEEFPANHFYERDDNYKSKRKRNNTDSEVNDSHIVNKGFPEDNFHETKYKHKSKRKRIDTDADL